MRFHLSKIVPVLMRSTFGLVLDDGPRCTMRAVWVQWRGRILWQRMTPA